MSLFRRYRIATLCIFTIWSTLTMDLTVAGPLVDPSVRVRTAQGISQYDVARAVRREIDVIANSTKGFDVKGSTSLDRSWDDAVLLKFGSDQTATETNTNSLEFSESVEIKCTQCYIKGNATGQLSIGQFNASRIIHQSLHQVENDFKPLIHDVEDFLHRCFDDIGEDILEVTDMVMDIAEGDTDIDSIDFKWPTFNYSLNMEVPAIPEAKLHFSFDDLELYMKMDTVLALGSTYTLNLYTSETPLGLEISDELSLGIVFTVDLILDVEGKIDVSSGFHIKIDDGLGIDLTLFGHGASGITFNGGQFEFLPVTVESAGITFKAILRVGAHAGFDLNTPATGLPDVTVFGVTLPPEVGVGVGIDVAVFADVAEFVTNVKYDPDHVGCELGVDQAYTFALGVGAGATLSLGTHKWGPTPTTVVPIWYTTFASACAIKSSPTPTAMPSNHSVAAIKNKRGALSTATITTEVTYTGVKCISSGMVNCPASLQTTSKSTASTVFTTVVPSGKQEDDITLATHKKTVPTTVAFGAKAVKLPSIAGKPVSYTPPPPKPTSTSNATASGLEDAVHHPDKKLIAGLSVGLGVPALLAFAAAAFFVHKRRKSYNAVPVREPLEMVSEPYEPFVADGMAPEKPGRTAVHVSEVRRYSDGS